MTTSYIQAALVDSEHKKLAEALLADAKAGGGGAQGPQGTQGPQGVPGGLAGITGTGIAGQVALWDGTTSLTGDAGLTYAAGALTVTDAFIIGSFALDTVLFGATVLVLGQAGLTTSSSAPLQILNDGFTGDPIAGTVQFAPANFCFSRQYTSFTDSSNNARVTSSYFGGQFVFGGENVGSPATPLTELVFGSLSAGENNQISFYVGNDPDDPGAPMHWNIGAKDGTANLYPVKDAGNDLGGASNRVAAGYINQLKSTPVALATLGAAATAGAGTRAFISDGLTLGNWGDAAVDGGVVVKPVWSNGVAWLNGA